MPTLSPCLWNLFGEINTLWPSRDRRTDGWYRSPSVGISVGHNPGHNGLVHAIDVDRDGIDPIWIINNIYRGGGALYYIIWDRRVWSTRTGWDGHRYAGLHPHTDHMHIEIYQTNAAEYYRGGWGLARAASGIGTAPGYAGGSGDQYSAGIGAADDRDPRGYMSDIANDMAFQGNYVQTLAWYIRQNYSL